jgi:hypothetical protein
VKTPLTKSPGKKKKRNKNLASSRPCLSSRQPKIAAKRPSKRSARGIVDVDRQFLLPLADFHTMNARQPKRKNHRAALLGLAFNAEDGQKRITRGPNFLLAGGSQETHGMLQETALKINEHLDRKGKQLADVSPGEIRDIVEDIHG